MIQSPERKLKNMANPLKRKSNSHDGFQMPSRKQLITEEKMAACMQRLSLTQLDTFVPISQAGKSRSDDSDFEDGDDDLEPFDKDLNDEERLPVFEFAPGMKESFQKMAPLIHNTILEKLIQKPCMALVPYVPPADHALRLILDKDIDEKSNASKTNNDARSENEVDMADESFTVDWDSDCDDNFLLD